MIHRIGRQGTGDHVHAVTFETDVNDDGSVTHRPITRCSRKRAHIVNESPERWINDLITCVRCNVILAGERKPEWWMRPKQQAR